MAVAVRKRAISEFVQADCAVSDQIKDVVRVSADAVNGVYQVSKIDITALPVELVLGVIVLKPSSTRCIVQVGGQVLSLYSGLTPGGMLFVGADSRLTHDVPTHPGTGVKFVHHAAIALASDSLLLKFASPFKILP